MKLVFVRKQHEVGEIYSYFFQPKERLDFTAGQYMNLTMPDVPPANADRLMSITSAPHEELLQFTTFVTPSAFKQKMHALQPGEEIEADQLGGDFTYEITDIILKLFHDPVNIKRLFIAGGIGITPYISMIRDHLHNQLPMCTTLLYAGKNEKRPFLKELQTATEADHSLVLREYSDQRLTLEQLKKDIPDIRSYVVYLAGSQKFSEAIGEGLIQSGMPRQQIKYDYFDGYIDIEY